MRLPENRTKRGIALLTTLFALAIVSVIGFAIVTLSLTEYRTTNSNIMISQAYYCARSGIAMAKANLKSNYNWTGTGSTPGVCGDGNFQVTSVYYGSGTNNKCWLVTSVGTYQNATRTLKIWMGLDSFAKFAYFTNQELCSAIVGGSGVIWFTDRDKINGPVHTNGYFSISGTPDFSDKMTSANTSDSCYNSSTKKYTQGGKTYTDLSKFYRYYSSYSTDYPVALDGSESFSFSGAQPSVPLPEDTGSILSNATKTYACDTTILLKDDGTMNVTYTKSGVTKTDNLSTSNTTLYIDGKVSIKGTLSGKLTVGSTGNISITDNLLYKDKSKDVLGLCSNGYIKIDTASVGHQNLEIDAAMLALNDSIYYPGYSNGRTMGTLTVYGSLIQKKRGPVSQFSGNTITSGYAKNYIYDQKLMESPPPNFPTTGSVVVRAWRDMNALGN